MTFGAAYRAEIAGTAAGAFDRVNVTGTASLGNATLDLALLNFDPTPGNSFTILQTTGGVSGTFFGLADLAQFTVGDDTFQIDYTATAVVLTAVSIPLALTGLAPSVTLLESAIDIAPQILDADVTLTGNLFAGGSLTVSGLLAADTVGIRSDGFEPGQIGVELRHGVLRRRLRSVPIAGGVGADLTVDFNGSATRTAVEALIEHLTYFSAAEPPTASRTLTVTVTDASAASIDADIVVNVTAQNDAPVNTVPDGPLTVAEDTDLTINGLSVSDADFGLADMTVTLTVQHGTLTVDETVSGGLDFQRDHRQRHRHRHADLRPHRHQHDARRRRDLPRRSELQRSRHADDDLQRRRVERRRSGADRRRHQRGGHRHRRDRRDPGGRRAAERGRRRAEQRGGGLAGRG